MNPIVPKWVEDFSKLDDDSKMMLVQMGIESFMRAWTFHATGLTTLKGAMHYVDSNSPALCDVMLHALNGSNQHRQTLHDFMNDDRCKKLGCVLHPVSALTLFEKQKA